MRIVKSAKKQKQNKERPRHAEIPKQIFKVFLFLQQRRKIRRFYFGLALQTRTGFRFVVCVLIEITAEKIAVRNEMKIFSSDIRETWKLQCN